MIELFTYRLMDRCVVIGIYVAALCYDHDLWFFPFVVEAVLLWFSIKYVEGSWGCLDCGASGRGHRSVHRCAKETHR